MEVQWGKHPIVRLRPGGDGTALGEGNVRGTGVEAEGSTEDEPGGTGGNGIRKGDPDEGGRDLGGAGGRLIGADTGPGEDVGIGPINGGDVVVELKWDVEPRVATLSGEDERGLK